MGRRKSGSLAYQINQRMNALNRIGESKHQAKQDYRNHCERNGLQWNPAKANGIFSHKTFDAYKQSTTEFSKWLKENHPEVRHINQIEKQHSINYLQQRQDQGKSAWTLSKDMSALNKVFNLNVTKQEAGIRERSYRDAERSRVERQHDRSYNAQNYRQQIDFAKAFGVRRESIYNGQYQVKDVSLFRHDGKIYASVIEKGGRYREAPCLEKMQSTIEKHFPHISEREPLTKEQFQAIYSTSENYLFDRYSNKIDNHAFRHEYARNLYQEALKELNEKHTEREVVLHRGFDRDALGQVSEALGHSPERTTVVLEHYLR